MAAKGRREPYRVFVSYSHRDRWIAKQCGKLIEEAGGKVFWDEEGIEGGQHIPEKIREQLRGCDELIVIVSPHSKDRDWVKIEASAAWGLRKLIVPIMLSVDPQEMLDILKSNKAFDLNKDEFETSYLPQLVRRVKGRLK